MPAWECKRTQKWDVHRSIAGIGWKLQIKLHAPKSEWNRKQLNDIPYKSVADDRFFNCFTGYFAHQVQEELNVERAATAAAVAATHRSKSAPRAHQNRAAIERVNANAHLSDHRRSNRRRKKEEHWIQFLCVLFVYTSIPDKNEFQWKNATIKNDTEHKRFLCIGFGFGKNIRGGHDCVFIYIFNLVFFWSHGR